MYKNRRLTMKSYQDLQVSILVLMDLCIKTVNGNCQLCIFIKSFNPCFNGSMYKNLVKNDIIFGLYVCFNPCFNGSMYKNQNCSVKSWISLISFNPCFNGSMYKNIIDNQLSSLYSPEFQSLF